MEPTQFRTVTRLLIEPITRPRPYDKPQLLPGIWLDGIAYGEFAGILNECPADPYLPELRYVLVIDGPAYFSGLADRLRSEAGGEDRLKELMKGLSEVPFDHPPEMYVDEEDLMNLVMVGCILAGATAFVLDRPIRVETESSGEKTHRYAGTSRLRYVWRPPFLTRRKQAEERSLAPLEIGTIQYYCSALEAYFRPIKWHSGRLAVALGSFMSYALATDDVQAYLALMTVLEALLSTGGTEITHQIAERAACLLEHSEDGRLTLYRRVKKLYATRSQLVHGAVENRKGNITNDNLRVDARFKIVPDEDYAELFSVCTRLLTTVLKNEQLVTLMEERARSELNEWYLRLILRGL